MALLNHPETHSSFLGSLKGKINIFLGDPFGELEMLEDEVALYP